MSDAPPSVGTGAAASFGVQSWHARSLPAEAGHRGIPPQVLSELTACVVALERSPRPVVELSPGAFRLQASRAFGARLREELDHGLGFVLLDRLPVADWGRTGSIAAFWLLASCIARPVAQSHAQVFVYDVMDRGRPVGNGVRPDVTNVAQNFHTDNSYNHVPPRHVALLCLQAAVEGGVSGIVNFRWALDEMRRRHPDLVGRLFEPFYFDRQREHADGDIPVTHHPLFQIDGDRLCARLSYRQVVNGQRLAGEPLDAAGRAALEAFEAVLNEPGASREFRFEPGQLQVVNNQALGHRRSEFRDGDAPGQRRHLVRLWLRDEGAAGYHG